MNNKIEIENEMSQVSKAAEILNFRSTENTAFFKDLIHDLALLKNHIGRIECEGYKDEHDFIHDSEVDETDRFIGDGDFVVYERIDYIIGQISGLSYDINQHVESQFKENVVEVNHVAGLLANRVNILEEKLSVSI